MVLLMSYCGGSLPQAVRGREAVRRLTNKLRL